MEKWVIVRKGYVGDLNSLLGVARRVDSSPVRIVHNQEIEAAGGVEGYLKLLASEKNTNLHNKAIYPDLVMSCHNESTEYAVHIKRRSGGRSFLANLRDPEGEYSAFDLIARPNHERNISGDNVISVIGIAHKVTAEEITREANLWRDRLVPDAERRMKIAVMVGGGSDPSAFEQGGGPLEAKQLEVFGSSLLELAQKHNAVIIASNSHRTPEEGWNLFREAISPCAHFIHDWRRGPADGNPYLAMLGFADVIVTTADSMSMGCEAASTGKPHYIGGLNFSSVRSDHRRLAHELISKGYSKALANFEPALSTEVKPALDTTGIIASAIALKIQERSLSVNL